MENLVGTSGLVSGFTLEAQIEKSEKPNLISLGLFLGQMGFC